MRVDRIFETALYADDVDATVRFYLDVLGLEPVTTFGPRGAALRCGAGVLLIFDPELAESEALEVPPHGARGRGHVAFVATADELPGWREHLAHCGVEIETEVEWPSGGRSIYFRDPAGNSVELGPPAMWGLPG